MWGKDQNGCFTVKNTYQLQCLETNDQFSGFSWSRLWNNVVHPKVQHLVWKATKNLLPTTSNLIGKLVKLEDLCPLCQSHPETTEHALLEYNFAKQIWSGRGLSFPSPQRTNFKGRGGVVDGFGQSAKDMAVTTARNIQIKLRCDMF